MRRTGAIIDTAGLAVGDHICWTYASDFEHRATLSAFFAAGVEAGERLLYMAPSRDLPLAAAALRMAGIDPEALTARGGLMLAPVDDIYLHGERFDAGEQLTVFRGLVDQAVAQGYTGLRACAECAGLLRDPAIRERWPAYELRADLLASAVPLIGMCAYDRRVADEPTLELLRSVHRLHLASGRSSDLLFHIFSSPEGSLHVGGELDFTCSDTVRTLVDACIADLREPELDLTSLRFCDVAGARSIAMIARRMAEVHERVVLRGASMPFRRLWSLADLDRLAPVVMT